MEIDGFIIPERPKNEPTPKTIEDRMRKTCAQMPRENCKGVDCKYCIFHVTFVRYYEGVSKLSGLRKKAFLKWETGRNKCPKSKKELL